MSWYDNLRGSGEGERSAREIVEKIEEKVYQQRKQEKKESIKTQKERIERKRTLLTRAIIVKIAASVMSVVSIPAWLKSTAACGVRDA